MGPGKTGEGRQGPFPGLCSPGGDSQDGEEPQCHWAGSMQGHQMALLLFPRAFIFMGGVFPGSPCHLPRFSVPTDELAKTVLSAYT